MTRLARLKSWIVASTRRAEFERDMAAEMQAHLELYEADLRSRGLSDAEARRRARTEFGSIEARREECREARGLRVFDELRGDMRYAFRLLRRSPAFTVVALLSLALGIGANTAIFSLVDTVLLKTLPVESPEQLFFIDNSGGKSGGSNGPPYPCFERLRDHNRFLSGIAAFDERMFKVTIDGVAEQVRGQYVSGSYYNVLGVTPILGRLLTPRDDSEFGRGGPDGPVGVISYGYWTRRFGNDATVLGKSVQVGTTWVTIIGVSPPEFFGQQVGRPLDITVPMMLVGRPLRLKQSWWLSVVGRLAPGATVEQARADLDALFDSYMTEIGIPRERRDYFSGIALVPAARGLNDLRRTYSEPLLIVMTIVGIVLLIGCANVANLLLARASARQNEMAVRLAIGASRGRLIRQLLTEGTVLALIGSCLGLLFARGGVWLLVGMLAGPGNDLLLAPAFDLRVLGFTAAVAMITALLFSLAPALRATRIDAAKPTATLRTGLERSGVRLGQVLVVTQVTLAVVLLCGAALFLRTLHKLNTLPPGFDRRGVLTMNVDMTVPGRTAPAKDPGEHRADHARLASFWREFVTRVRGLPGVTSAAAATMSPLSGSDRGVLIAISGEPLRPEKDRGIHLNHVTDGYFGTMGIRLLTGRLFTAADRTGSLRVAILNETAARDYFGSSNPIGRKVNFPRQRVEDEYEIVGVVHDTRYEDLRMPDERMAYLPLEQSIDPVTNAVMAVRAQADVMKLVPSIRAAASETLPGGFVTAIGSIEQRVQASLVRERMLSLLATFFAGLALTLACIGLYGVMAYRVVRRTREIGIRIAVGAGQRSVIWMMVRETLILLALGAALGTAVSLTVSGYVANQLFGVAPRDPMAIAVALVVLMGVTLAAGYLPARRASRIDPVVALRVE
ncbi:MAG: ABC transporter permease [Vicinamibacterales bacterium]